MDLSPSEAEADSRTLQAVHVYPSFGPEHMLETRRCWCHPEYEMAGVGVIVIHNVMH